MTEAMLSYLPIMECSVSDCLQRSHRSESNGDDHKRRHRLKPSHWSLKVITFADSGYLSFQGHLHCSRLFRKI